MKKEVTERSKKIKKAILAALGVTGLVGLGFVAGNEKVRTKVISTTAGVFKKKTTTLQVTAPVKKDVNQNRTPYLKERKNNYYYQKGNNRQALNS